jgi:hypothetical protein
MSADRTAESSADVRLDGDQMTADSDDGDAGHPTRRYMDRSALLQ